MQQFELNGVPVQVEADEVVLDFNRSVAILDGAATARMQDRVFSADHLEIQFDDPEHPAILATGDVRFDDPEHGRVTGSGLRYDMAIDSGSITNVEITVPLQFKARLSDLLRPAEQSPALRMAAESATREGGTWILRGGHITTSPDDPPQYELRAGELIVKTGKGGVLGDLKQIRGKDLKVQVYGSTILGFSNLQFGEGGILFPTVGFNDSYGLYVEHSFAPFAIRPARFVLRPRIGTDLLLSGSARFAIGSPLGVFEAIGSSRERKLLLRQPTASLLSRVPEIAWKVKDLPTPLGGHFSGRASYGQYDEEGNLTTWRTALSAEYQLPVYSGQTSRLSVSGGAFAGWYHGTGQEYGWLRGGLNFEKRFGYRLYTGLDIKSHQIYGSSPIFYDQIEVATELSGRVRLKVTDHWLLDTQLMLDMNDGVLRREQYGITYRDRLLEYGVSVLSRPHFELMFDAQLLGF